MTTRNQKRKQSANTSNLKPTVSTPNGVDLQKHPIVALPASNSQSELSQKNDASNFPATKQVQLASALPSSSSPREPATPMTAAAAKPLRNTTSNPVVKDIVALKSGELKIVSPAVSKYFGFPAGPVSNLDFSDPKVADFFEVPVIQPSEKLDSTRTASGSAAGLQIPISSPVLHTHMTSDTVSPPLSGSLQQGNLTHPTMAAAGGSEVGPGCSARPLKAADSLHSTSQTAAPASWAGLFKGNRTLTDDAKLSPNFNGVTSEKVVLDDDDLEDDGEEKRSLIGFFNGKFPGIKAIQHIVDDWSRKCSFHRHNSGWLVFTFDEEVDCDIVLKEGPYYAFNKPLVLKKMPEFFDFSDEAYSTAPVWIQLPNLPLRAWKKSALEKICSFLGTPLQLDQVTKEKERKSFARCLVEIDVSKDLPTHVCVTLPRGKTLKQHVLYEETPTFCSNCKKLGHESEDCYASNNGVPSLYVVRNKKEKGKTGHKNEAAGVKNGQAGSSAMAGAGNRNSGQDFGSGSGQNSAPVSGQAAAVKGAQKASAMAASGQVFAQANQAADFDTLGHKNKAIDHGNKAQPAAGNLERNLATRQANSAPKTTGLNSSKGADSGVVSNNSFGPLANGKEGNWANETEANEALKNNNTNKNNGKKK